MFVCQRQSVTSVVEEKTCATLKAEMKLNAIHIYLTTDEVLGGSAVVVLQHKKPLFNLTELLYSHSVIFL
jgi:hypothetical protein